MGSRCLLSCALGCVASSCSLRSWPHCLIPACRACLQEAKQEAAERAKQQAGALVKTLAAPPAQAQSQSQPGAAPPAEVKGVRALACTLAPGDIADGGRCLRSAGEVRVEIDLTRAPSSPLPGSTNGGSSASIPDAPSMSRPLSINAPAGAGGIPDAPALGAPSIASSGLRQARIE